MSRPLTPKQQRFVDEYLVDGNATQAAIRAGYKNANQMGPRLVGKSWFQEAIKPRQSALSERTEVTADWVVTHLKEEACDHGEGASHSARVRALEALGKTVGLFNQDVLKLLEQLIASFDPGSADRIREGIRQEVSQGSPPVGPHAR